MFATRIAIQALSLCMQFKTCCIPVSVSSYSTDFSADESPISEGGNWILPATDTYTNPPLTSGGSAFGNQNASSTNDSIAILNPARFTLGSHQIILATVVKTGSTDLGLELEVHLSSSSPSSTEIYSYEGVMVPGAGIGAIDFVKWRGAQGTYFVLPHTNGTDGVPHNSIEHLDKFRFEITGDASLRTLTCTQYKASEGYATGYLITQCDDTTAISAMAPFTTGTCGIGGDNGGSQYLNCGISRYEMTSS